jgi:uncharacterized membrane protein YbhN (UPF0104 family)
MRAATLARSSGVPEGEAMNLVRILISLFMVILLVIIALGWSWTGSHQAPALAMASHVVLGIAALAGIYALVTLWRANPQRSRRPH